jgi:RNA polymerase sigma-70 factor, ECF subfamily
MPEGLPVDQGADERLVADILLNEPGGGRRFCDRFGVLIRAVARRWIGPPDVDDAMQAIYVRLCERDWRVLRQWDKSGPLHAYVAVVAKNVCLDILRRRRPQVETDPPELLDEDPANDPEATTFAREIRECLEQALLALSETYRRIIRLRHYEGLKHAEIAARLGKTPGYVGPTLQRAERYLRDEVREHCGDHLGPFAAVIA